MAMLREVAKYQPSGCQVSQDITSYLHGLHVDYEADGTPTLYDVPSTSIIEFRGNDGTMVLNHKFLNLLLMNAMDEISEHTLLGHLHKEFLLLSKIKSFKLKKMFLSYLESLFEDPEQLQRIRQEIIDTPTLDSNFPSVQIKMLQDFEELQHMLPIETYNVT
jgi:hypothetical protein